MLTKIHPDLDKLALEVLNLPTSEILHLMGNTALNQTTTPDKILMKLIGSLIGTMNSQLASKQIENKKECLMILSSIITSPYFIDSLTPHQHQAIAKLMSKHLFSLSQQTELIYKELIAPLLDTQTEKTKPYLKLSIRGFIRILEKASYSNNQEIELRNNLTRVSQFNSKFAA